MNYKQPNIEYTIESWQYHIAHLKYPPKFKSGDKVIVERYVGMCTVNKHNGEIIDIHSEKVIGSHSNKSNPDMERKYNVIISNGKKRLVDQVYESCISKRSNRRKKK